MVEGLERRALLSATIEDPVNMMVQIRGTEEKDDIVVQLVQRGSGRRVISVTVTSEVAGQSSNVSIVRTFGRSEVGSFNILGFGGDDFIDIEEFSSIGGTGSIPSNTFGFIGGKINLNAWVDGGAGDDRINTAGGDDSVTGGAGNDTINGGGGEDRLLGQDGRDELFGGHGNDSLRGGGGRDWIRGSYGDDLLDGGDGRDRVEGGPGRDVNNEGAYDAVTGEQVRVEGLLTFSDRSNFGAPPAWRVIGGSGTDHRDGVDVEITGFEERANLLLGKRVVATGHIMIRNITERADVRVLILDSIKEA